uniref:Uncharacterized protein n=1 Tax=Pyricularia oryzae (strain P131) TaxID=1143193 RepID=L7IQK0_PYRO1
MSDERSIPIGGHCPPNSTLKIIKLLFIRKFYNFSYLNLKSSTKSTSAKSRSGEAAKPRSY